MPSAATQVSSAPNFPHTAQTVIIILSKIPTGDKKTVSSEE